LLVAGCWGGKREAADPLAPRVYLEHALALMRSNAVYTPKGGWSAVEAEATKRAASATTAAQTYPALEKELWMLRASLRVRRRVRKLGRADLQGNRLIPWRGQAWRWTRKSSDLRAQRDPEAEPTASGRVR
jgi:hypothetical protein